MTLDEATRSYVLSTGRKVCSHDEIIGLRIRPDPGDDPATVHCGFDGDIYCDDWTRAERVELAEFMIQLWTEYRDSRA